MCLYCLVLCSDEVCLFGVFFCDIIGIINARVSLSWPSEADVGIKPHIDWARPTWCFIRATWGTPVASQDGDLPISIQKEAPVILGWVSLKGFHRSG